MSRFIEFTGQYTDNAKVGVAVNPRYVKAVRDQVSEGGGTMLYIHGDSAPLHVLEPFDEVMHRLNSVDAPVQNGSGE